MKLEITEVFGHRVKVRHGHLEVKREVIDTTLPGDYGADPIGDGRFRMVPSGEVVDLAERNVRMNAAAARRGMRRVW